MWTVLKSEGSKFKSDILKGPHYNYNKINLTKFDYLSLAGVS